MKLKLTLEIKILNAARVALVMFCTAALPRDPLRLAECKTGQDMAAAQYKTSIT